MITTNGWTCKEVKTQKDLVTKANWPNLIMGYNAFAQEIGRRNAIKQKPVGVVELNYKDCGHLVKEFCDCDYYTNDEHFEEGLK